LRFSKPWEYNERNRAKGIFVEHLLWVRLYVSETILQLMAMSWDALAGEMSDKTLHC
jgi:hypothetical protein